MAYQQVISSKFLNTALEIQFFMNFDTFFLAIIINYYPVLHADHHFRRYMHQSIIRWLTCLDDIHVAGHIYLRCFPNLGF